MSSVQLLKGLSANNIIVTPTRGPSRARKGKRNASSSPIPKARPSTRAKIKGTKIVDYDMKHHPMDDTLRPKAAVKRAAAKRAAVKSSTHSMTGKGSYRKGSVSAGSKASTASVNTMTTSRSTSHKIPAKQDLSTLLDKPLTDEWSDLATLDRRIFCLQRGAPASGKTLPFKWSQIVDQVGEEGLLSKAQLKACGGTEALIERYELVRLHVQELFGAADEASDWKDFKVLYAEGFDVYDLAGSEAEHVHPNARDTAGAQTATKPISDHSEGGGADVQMVSGIAEEVVETVTPTEAMFLRSESEESEEIPWEEQIWGPGGVRPEELDGNGDYVGSVEQFREDVFALIDDVTTSQEDISEVYEEVLTPVQPTDIILSDRASTTNSDDHTTGRIERRTQQSTSATLTESTAASSPSDSAVPLAKMTANMIGPETGLREEQVSMPTSDTHETEFAQQSWPPGTLTSVLAELEREKQKKILLFTKVLENGPLLPIQMASQEETLQTNGGPHSLQIASGSAPVLEKSIALHLISPGVDVPKENLEDDIDVDDHMRQPLLEITGARTHDTQSHQRSVIASPSVAARTQRVPDLPARSHIARSLFGPFAQGALDEALASVTTSQVAHNKSLRAMTGATVVSASDDRPDAYLGVSIGDQKQTRPKASDFM